MPTATGGSFRFIHNVAAVIQQLRLSIGVDAQRALGDTAALLDDRDRQLEDFLSQLDVRIGTTAGVPSGGMFDWAGSTAPDGYLLCDGSAVNRADYPDLFLAIGTIWGAGNGSTTFNLPDFRGRVTIGAGAGTGLTARTVGQRGGEEAHTLTVPELAAHTHSAVGQVTTAAIFASGSAVSSVANILTNVTGSTGSGTAHNNMQPYAVVTKIVKT